MDSRNVTLREEGTNKKTRLYLYNAIRLFTPSNVSVRQMPLDLDNGLLGVVLRIGKTNNDYTISFLAHVDTCVTINMSNLLLHKYIITKHPSLVAEYPIR